MCNVRKTPVGISLPLHLSNDDAYYCPTLIYFSHKVEDISDLHILYIRGLQETLYIFYKFRRHGRRH